MATLKDYPIIDFSGGIVRNKSSYAMKKNELLSAYNVEIDELGRVIRRRGNQHHGGYTAFNTTAGGKSPTGCENSFVYFLSNVSSAPIFRHFVNDFTTTGYVAEITGSYLTSAITTVSTTIPVASATNFSIAGTTGMCEIEGDIITYTGVSGSNLTGASVIDSNHASGSPVHALREIAQPSTVFDTTQGCYYALASDGTTPNTCFVSSRTVLASITSGAFSAPITFSDDTDKVAVLFLNNYRDRLYGCGSGSGTTANSGANRVFYSALGNASDNNWTKANYFDLPTTDLSSALKTYNDVQYAFTINNLFAYNQITLKRRSSIVGAYNNKCPQEINGLMYTFCPSGIWVTNGTSHRKISDPVKEYIKNFKPQFDAYVRVITNTFAYKEGDNYCVYLGSITKPETQSNIILKYNTIKKNWTVDFTDIQWLHAKSFPIYPFGGKVQEVEGVFAGSSGTATYRYWKLFSNEHVNGAGTSTGGDLRLDSFFNTGNDIPAHFETQLYDLATPQYIKKFKYIRGLSEVVGWNAEYRVENKEGVTLYKPIGQFQRPNQRLVIPKTPEGYRIGFRFSNNDRNSTGVFNGFIIEDTEALPSKQ